MTRLGDYGPTVVVGGGIAGAFLAAVLGQRGEPVTVFDSRPDPRTALDDAGRSINLAIAERGLVALRHIGLVDRIEQIVVAMRGRIVHDDGAQAMLPYGNLADEVLWSVDRAALTALLLDAETSNFGLVNAVEKSTSTSI